MANKEINELLNEALSVYYETEDFVLSKYKLPFLNVFKRKDAGVVAFGVQLVMPDVAAGAVEDQRHCGKVDVLIKPGIGYRVIFITDFFHFPGSVCPEQTSIVPHNYNSPMKLIKKLFM